MAVEMCGAVHTRFINFTDQLCSQAMPRLIHRAACVALAAAAALGTARAAYIFDAHNCNTNFDGDVRNWDNPPFGSGTTPPMRIRFGAANATWRPVNVLVTPGTYRFGGLQLQVRFLSFILDPLVSRREVQCGRRGMWVWYWGHVAAAGRRVVWCSFYCCWCRDC